jgi:hypothetical protein
MEIPPYPDDEEEVRRLRDEEEVRRLRDDLTQARLDLINSDAIRAELVEQTLGLAKDMARALEMVEKAFHAGYKAVLNRHLRHTTPESAYRLWTEEIQRKV